MKSRPLVLMQQLEPRTLFSGTLAPLPMPSAAIQSTTQVLAPVSGPSRGPTLHVIAGIPFSGQVAFYPSPVLDPPLAYSAAISWGDGTTSQATLEYGMQGNSGGYLINGTHSYAKSGTYKILTTVASGPIVTPGQPPLGLPITIVAKITSKAIVTTLLANSSGGVTITPTTGQSFISTIGSFVTPAPATGMKATISWAMALPPPASFNPLVVWVSMKSPSMLSELTRMPKRVNTPSRSS